MSKAAVILLHVLTATVAARGDVLRPVDAVEQALNHSPQLIVLERMVEEDRASVGAAVRIRNPELRTSLASSELIFPALEGRPYDEIYSDLELGVRWSPPNLGSWAARKASAMRRVDQSEARLRRAALELAARVLTLHAQLLSLDEEIALAETAVELRDQLRQLTAKRVEQLAATGLDQSLAELDYLDAVTELDELKSQRRELFNNLLIEMGSPATREVELSPEGGLPCAPASDGLDDLIARARANQPGLDATRASLAEAEADLTRSYLEIIPWLDFVHFSYELGQGSTAFQLGGGKDAAALRVRMGLRLPLFDWNGAEIDTLKVRRLRFEAEIDAELARLDNRVRRTVQELASRYDLYQRSLDVDEHVVADSLDLIRRALEVGETDLVNMALVQSRTLRARRGRLRAHLRCRETRIELAQITGALLQDVTTWRTAVSAPQ